MSLERQIVEIIRHLNEEKRLGDKRAEQFYNLIDAFEGGDEKVAIDAEATPGYLGAAFNSGVLRTGAPLTYADGGDFITLGFSHLGLQSLVDPDADRIMVWDDSAGALKWLGLGGGVSIDATPDLNIDHDTIDNFVANEHIDHTAVTLTAGEGLSGGGTIAANRTFDLAVNGLVEDSAIASGDFLVYYDTVAGDHKKIDLDDLPGGGTTIIQKARTVITLTWDYVKRTLDLTAQTSAAARWALVSVYWARNDSTDSFWWYYYGDASAIIQLCSDKIGGQNYYQGSAMWIPLDSQQRVYYRAPANTQAREVILYGYAE